MGNGLIMADSFSSMVGSTSPMSTIMSLPAETEAKQQTALDALKVKEQESLTKQDALYTGAMKKYNDAMASVKPVADANLQNVPDAPNQKMQDPTQVLGSLGTILAIFGSMKTRAPMTSALNSMAAAMKGFHQGDQEAIKLNQQKWQNDFKKALAQNQIEMQRYMNALEKNKFDMNAAQADLKVLSIEMSDQQMHDAVTQGDFTKQSAIMSGRLNAGMKGAEIISKMQATAQAERDRQQRMSEAAAAHRDAQQVIVMGANGPELLDKSKLPTAQPGEKGLIKFGASTAQLGSSKSPGDETLHGDAYLQSLPGNIRDLVNAVDKWQMAPPTSFAMRYPPWPDVMSALAHYDPKNLNLAKYQVHLGVQNDFASGKSAINATAINTAIGHMDSLKHLALAEKNGDIATVNSIVNAAKTEFGDPNINNAAMAAHALSSELMRTFRTVGASDTGVHDFESKLDVNKGPDVILGALKTGASLLNSRINALQDQWKRGMQTNDPFPNLVSPRSVQVLQGFGINVEPQMPTVSSSVATKTPLPPTNAKGWKLMKDAQGNQAYVGPNNEIEEVQ